MENRTKEVPLKNIQNQIKIENETGKKKVWQKPVLVELNFKYTKGGAQSMQEDVDSSGVFS